MTVTAPPRTRRTCCDCGRRRLCYQLPIRGPRLRSLPRTLPICEECIMCLPRDPDDPTRLA